MKRLLLLMLLATSAHAHEWYDLDCCDDQDCAPIPSSSVKAGPNGWEVTLHPGDHPLVRTPILRTMPYEKARKSEDGGFHACTMGGGLICLYAPPMAF